MNFKEYNLALSQQTFEHLEDAIARVMEEKSVNPQSIIYIYPSSQELYDKWEEKYWWVCTNMAYSNLPVLGTVNDSFDLATDMPHLIESIRNRKTYISALAAQICEEFEVKSDAGWELSVIGVDIDSEVYLLIGPEHWLAAKEAVAKYNTQAKANGYPALSTDDNLKTVTGQHRAKPVTGGFFDKRKIKKQNSDQEQSYRAFLSSLTPYLRKSF